MEPFLLPADDAPTGAPAWDSVADFIYCHSPFDKSWMATGYMQQICPTPTPSTCQMYLGVPPVRVSLINARCRYFATESGCQNPYCRFLHDEPFQDAVFCDSTETFMERCQSVTRVQPTTAFHGPSAAGFGLTRPRLQPWSVAIQAVKEADATALVEAVDVRIFFGNCPAYDADARIRDVVEPIGQVDRLDIIPSTLHNRRVSGFIHMSSLEAAEAAVDKLNATKLGRRGAKVYAKIKSCETVLRPAPDEDDLGLRLSLLPPLIEVDEDVSFGDSESSLTVVAVGIDGVTAPAPATAPAAALDDLDPDDHLCIVCMEGEKTHILYPCCHHCLCEACAQKKQWTECPVCRGPVQQVLRIFS